MVKYSTEVRRKRISYSAKGLRVNVRFYISDGLGLSKSPDGNNPVGIHFDQFYHSFHRFEYIS